MIPELRRKFRMGDFEWYVDTIDHATKKFKSRRVDAHSNTCWLNFSDADRLKWLKEEPSCSKVFARLILRHASHPDSGIHDSCFQKLRIFIDSHTEV